MPELGTRITYWRAALLLAAAMGPSGVAAAEEGSIGDAVVAAPSSIPQVGDLVKVGTVANDTIEVASNPLEAAALAFARAVLDTSGGAMSAVFTSEGIRLQLDGPAHTGLSSRQAVASLRDFLRAYEGAGTAVNRAAPVAGSPDRGFAEIHWSARVAGTSQAIQRVLFVGLVSGSGGWQVDEVRLLP